MPPETFKRTWRGWTRSSHGYSVRLLGRKLLQYKDEHGELDLSAEAMSKTWSEVVVYTAIIPDRADQRRDEVVSRLRRAFAHNGWTMVEAGKYANTKSAVLAGGYPSADDNLLGMEMDFHAFLSGSDLLDDVQLRRTDDPTCLLTATCETSVTANEAIVELQRIWESHLRYEWLEAHEVSQRDDVVVFDALTQSSPNGLFVTARIAVTLR